MSFFKKLFKRKKEVLVAEAPGTVKDVKVAGVTPAIAKTSVNVLSGSIVLPEKVRKRYTECPSCFAKCTTLEVKMSTRTDEVWIYSVHRIGEKIKRCKVLKVTGIEKLRAYAPVLVPHLLKGQSTDVALDTVCSILTYLAKAKAKVDASSVEEIRKLLNALAKA